MHTRKSDAYVFRDMDREGKGRDGIEAKSGGRRRSNGYLGN